jgi:type IV pilus assembly protein PilO
VRLTPRNRLIVVAVGAGIIVVLLFLVLVLPQFGKMRDLGTQIAAADQEAQAASALLDQRREVKDAASVTDATLLQLNNAVPENPELPSLIIELQDVAYSSGVSLRGVTPGDPAQEDGQGFIAIPVDVETWGTWSDSVDFLQQLRRLARQVRVVDFESSLLDETAADDANIDVPPYYQVKMTSKLEVYVIPTSSDTSSSVPAPAPAQ